MNGGTAGMSCKIRLPSCMPSDSFEQLLDRAASWYGIEPDFGISGATATSTSAGRQAGDSARHGGGGGFARRIWSGRWPHCARHEWERLLPPAVVAGETGVRSNCRCTCRRNSWARARNSRSGARTAMTSEFELNLWELPQVGLGRNGRPHVGARRRSLCRCTAARLSRRLGDAWAAARASTRCIVTPERAYTDPHLGRGGRAAGIAVSLYGVRSERNWGCGDFRDLRERDRLGGGGTGRELRGAESAARDPQPPAVQHQPLPAELHLLPELPLPGRGGHGGFSALPPARAALRAIAGSGSARSRRCARRRTWSTSA